MSVTTANDRPFDRAADATVAPVHVCPLDDVGTQLQATGARHLITLINAKMMIDTPPGLEGHRHLRLAMNDIAEPVEGLTTPGQEHVRRLIRFIDDWSGQSPLLIHCWAGISRSSAAALVALSMMHPHAEARLLAAHLRRKAPFAHPNRMIIKLADAELGRDGTLIDAVEMMPTAEMESVGRPYTLDWRG